MKLSNNSLQKSDTSACGRHSLKFSTANSKIHFYLHSVGKISEVLRKAVRGKSSVCVCTVDEESFGDMHISGAGIKICVLEMEY